jgi:hypothetical protein
VIYFICDNKHEYFRTKEFVLRSLLHQLTTLELSLVNRSENHFKRMGVSLSAFSAVMWDIFVGILGDQQSLKPVCFVLDALDECEDESRI